MRLDKNERDWRDELLLKWLVLYGLDEPIPFEQVLKDGHFHEEGELRDEESEAIRFLEEAEMLMDAIPERSEWWYGLTDMAKARLKKLKQNENR
jgi:hypothetical protein